MLKYFPQETMIISGFRNLVKMILVEKAYLIS